ncbi:MULTISPECIES: TetR/AcrR family transcriptional regulator [unclassified Streptomyces]|uniref:TetR/AcrR family transcriptional regulator n=1 Tax=unclassified Streptomyces TaxID=2593676 RepID=UPI00081DB3D5|nr:MULTISPECIES: TetR/AcrR family transcriptional regulator [unclassified Streptomyces]MYR29120.1 TetR family transcriptional regulator [Streptomyces sp. SID4945]SCD36040.1 transcriptional regulator, TetR family [Streptomyces sp. TverLS-915]SCF44082.1 transcriptional regulator, TetR family [Streptomyces sp. LcepLS]
MSEPRTSRERYRAQVREDIKRHAWEQIATAGASALSLNAIAKRIGMSGPALYRYFASRDDLITDLVRDAYRSLADAFLARAAEGTDLPDLARTLRAWALADPQRYFLVYGTPLPGYHAPEDTALTASEIMTVLLDVCAAQDGPDTRPPGVVPPAEGYFAEHGEWTRGHPASPAARLRALTVWTRLHGVLSLELAGGFHGMGFDPAVLYAAEVESLMK